MKEKAYKIDLRSYKKKGLNVGNWVNFLFCDVQRNCNWEINRITYILPNNSGYKLGNGEFYDFEMLYPFEIYLVSKEEEIHVENAFVYDTINEEKYELNVSWLDYLLKTRDEFFVEKINEEITIKI